MHLLDLGCGPGLYCRRYAKAGLNVTGIDYSRRSIAYAMDDAKAQNFAATYHYQSYIDLAYVSAFDAITLIWCDFGALTDDERMQLLPRIYTALRPGGVFIFDIYTLSHLAALREMQHWNIQPHGGFWHLDPYVELHQVVLYPEADSDLSQYLILTADGSVMAHHIWNRSFSLDGIVNLLSDTGFVVESYWSDLTGKPWEDTSLSMGVIARKS